MVTGAAGILGTRFCRGLAEYGANVVLTDVNAAELHELAEVVSRECGVRAKAVACDIRSRDAVRALVDAAVTEFGTVDILVNNAATKTDDLEAFFAPTESFALDTWRDVMSVNLDGMFLVAQAFGEQMRSQASGGSIIQTASVYGVLAPDARIYDGAEYLGTAINTPAVYSASKAGVIGLTRHLAALWAPDRIRVNSLTPGGCESGQNAEFQQRYGARVPLGRMARPDEMVGAILYLASDASSYVTGHNLIVDGGLSAW